MSKKEITVDISTEYQEVIDFLTSTIHPFLARLKEQGIIKQDQDISNLTPDHTRFAVKQTQITQRSQEDSLMTYKLAICLHVLVGALQLVVHCGMGVALGR